MRQDNVGDQDRDRTVGEIGERRLIAEFTRAAAGYVTGAAGAPDVVIGSGDDAAVVDTGGPAVISTDTSVEGRHFRFDWSEPRTIGARAVVQSAADVAAMGGRTTGVVVSIACPPTTTVGVLLDVNDGIIGATHELGARVLGGDLVDATQMVIGVTVIGALDGQSPVVIGGAWPGDVLAVTGTALGAAAAGYALLADVQERGTDDLVRRHPELVRAFRLPAPDLAQGPAAVRRGVHAMTDISDGLIEELITMSAAANVRLDVRSSAIPVSDDMRSAAGELGADYRRWALTGGEDHELLAAFAPDTVPPGWTVIGEVVAGRGVSVDGAPADDLHGWQSFG